MSGRDRRVRGRRARRNRITDRDAVVVAVIAGAAGVAAALAGAAPTGWSGADPLVAFALVAFVSWSAASTPWWVLAIVAAVATLTADDLVWGLTAGIGFLLAALVGSRSWSAPWARAASAGLAFNALLRWDEAWFQGWSALVTGALAATVVITGLSRRGRWARRTVRRAALITLGVAALAIAGAAVAGLMAMDDLRDGERELRSAATALREGDVEAAAEALARSEALLGDASRTLDRPWARPALAIPVVGQHVRAVSEVARAAEELARSATSSVEQINVDGLRMVAGVIDVNAIEVLEAPFRTTSEALARTEHALGRQRSAWLIAPLGDRLAELDDELSALVRQTDRAADAVALAPSMLGADGPRTYFVAFTTPAEARGLGGFMGTFAQLSADDGRLDVVRTGQTSELNAGLADDRPVLDMSEEYLARYGRFGARLDDGSVSADFWSNVTMTPDLPTVADVITQLYPASGGDSIDGVIVLDVDTVARFLEITGPIRVDGPDGPIRLNARDARDYLLRDQYSEIDDDAERDAVLEQITSTLLADVFGGNLPAPRALATTLGPALTEGRMVMWSSDPVDQERLVALGVSGSLERPPADGIAVVNNNGGANKLDAYLRRSVTYESLVYEDSGDVRATATIRLANDAPSGLPDDAAGNPFGLPNGTNRTYVSVYSPWEFTSAEVDGAARGMEVERELGWNVYSTFVDIPAGGEVEVRIGFAGHLEDPDDYSLVLRSQALAMPDVVRVDARSDRGRALVASHQPRFGLVRLPEPS